MFVALWLLRLAWKDHNKTVSLPNAQLEAHGIDRRTKRRALQELEAAGLIRIERRSRKAPVVTLLHL
jgi:hypothetical protein